MPLEKLTRSRVVEALNLLGKFAEQQDVSLELCIFGGSALMLAYGSREITKDVDAIVKPSAVGEELALRVAGQLRLDETWLNDDVRRFLSDAGTFAPLNLEDLEAAAKKRLKITRASAGYLLAMKCLAARAPLPGYSGDIEDIEFLIRKMGFTRIEQIEEQITRFYPHDALSPKARETVQALLLKQNNRNK